MEEEPTTVLRHRYLFPVSTSPSSRIQSETAKAIEIVHGGSDDGASKRDKDVSNFRSGLAECSMSNPSLEADAPGWSSVWNQSSSVEPFPQTSSSTRMRPKTAAHQNNLKAASDDGEFIEETYEGKSGEANLQEPTAERGPICWKCQGSGRVESKPLSSKQKRKKQPLTDDTMRQNTECPPNNAPTPTASSTSTTTTPTSTPCRVCQGRGWMKARPLSHRPGRITRACLPSDYSPCGPLPWALQQETKGNQPWIKLVLEQADAQGHHVDLTPHVLQTIRQEQEQHDLADKVDEMDTNSNNNKKKQFKKDNKDDNRPALPIHNWIPSVGEELCRLTGSWRILQQVQNHRWTTDDLVTAWCAAQQFPALLRQDKKKDNGRLCYLDLGTGNASVLQMVVWSSLVRKGVALHTAIGVEARSQAVALAQRSLSFNLEPLENEQDDQPKRYSIDNHNKDTLNGWVQVVHSDFRNYNPLNHEGHPQAFDLITGTPPYFRVEFQTTIRAKQAAVVPEPARVSPLEKNDPKHENPVHESISSAASNDRPTRESPAVPMTDPERTIATCSSTTTSLATTRAVIRQGGMPTAMASAPARCEFRGGIEAYVHTAAQWLAVPHGRFVVCENWLNHDRVEAAAQSAGLCIVQQVHVHGKQQQEQATRAPTQEEQHPDSSNETHAHETTSSYSTRPTKRHKKKKVLSAPSQPLFAVYVMMHRNGSNDPNCETSTNTTDNKNVEKETASTNNSHQKDTDKDSPTNNIIKLAVRNAQGQWTRQYLDTVMKDMNMPTLLKDREPL